MLFASVYFKLYLNINKSYQQQAEKMQNKLKFLKISKSQTYDLLNPHEISKRIHNNQFLYLDFADSDPKISIMEPSDPNDGDSEQQLMKYGDNYIGGLNHLSSNTYNIVKYLSENRVHDQKIAHLDEFVRKRIQKIRRKNNEKKKNSLMTHSECQNISIKQNDRKIDRSLSEISKPMKVRMKGNFSVLEDRKINIQEDRKQNEVMQVKFKPIKPKQHKFIDPEKIQEYLQKLSIEKIKLKFKEEQKNLQKSISSTKQYRKLHQKSIDYRINNKEIKLPSISKRQKNY